MSSVTQARGSVQLTLIPGLPALSGLTPLVSVLGKPLLSSHRAAATVYNDTLTAGVCGVFAD